MEQSVCKLQNRALNSADDYLGRAEASSDARDAADWTLAAKNAASVATSCETILKIKNGGGR